MTNGSTHGAMGSVRRALDVAQPHLWLTIAWIVQLVRMRYGVDFNDEMQYYGQIASIVETRHIFNDDLFVQQLVYIPFAPLFALQHAWFPGLGVVFFGRCLFAAMVMATYACCRRSLLRVGTADALAAFCALCVTFALPLYNIYAISYNSVATACVAAGISLALAWRGDLGGRRLVALAAVNVLLALAHPPLGAFGGLATAAYVGRTSGIREAGRFAAALGLGLAVVAVIVYMMSSPSDWRAAFAFSRAFNVGRVPPVAEIAPLGLPPLMIALGGLCANLFKRPLASRASYLALAVLSLFLALHVVMIAVGRQVWDAALLLACWAAFALGLNGNRAVHRQGLMVVATCMLAGVVVGITSSNGIKQAHGFALLSAPFCVALAASGREARTGSKSLYPLPALQFGLLAGMLALWLANPYRDDFLWKQDAVVAEGSAFRNLVISSAKSRAISFARSEGTPGKPMLVVGAHPWIYLATDATPESPMIFMHLTGPEAAYSVVAERLSMVDPDLIVVAGVTTPSIAVATRDLIERTRMQCEERRVPDAIVAGQRALMTYYALLPVWTVCRRTGPGAAALGRAPRVGA